jgi:CubicO group peptidase (beta-lactamase class C family)
MLREIERIYTGYAALSPVPGLVHGIVADGCLAECGVQGVQDLASARPVTADTVFRIASMTKAFTALAILQLRDAGRLQLDAAAEEYVPELRGWRYPTRDSARIRVRDLLTHTAGFVTDDPWGDRQNPLSEDGFTQLLREGVPFARPPQTAMEYSNLGYALLGRVIANVAGQPYGEWIRRSLLQPLGMDSTGFDPEAAPPERRALGYRWEEEAWRAEPTLGHGAFSAMGGLLTSARDYARWVAFLLSAWPARDDADAGPVSRATVRELMQGANYPQLRQRPGRSGEAAPRQAVAYGMGLWTGVDAELGLTLRHSGGYPGYGSHMLLLPECGVGVFAFANRTYADPSGAVWDAALALHGAGLLRSRGQPVSAELATAYEAVSDIWRCGDVLARTDQLAMNFLLDRDDAVWARQLAALRGQLGDCPPDASLTALSALSGEFLWQGATGQLKGTIVLSPTRPPRIQELKLEARTDLEPRPARDKSTDKGSPTA